MFGTILITAITLLHLYAYIRADRLPLRKNHIPRKVLASVFAGLWLIFVLGRIYGHHGEGIAARVLEFTGMTWMASLFMIDSWLLIADILTGFGFLFRKAVPAFRYSAFGIGILVSVIALVQGEMPPVVSRYDIRIQGLPAHLDGTTAAVLADLHIGETLGSSWLAARVAQTMDLKPDIILLAGDIIEGHGGDDSGITRELGRLRAPLGVFAVKGNHETYSRRNHRADEIFRNAGIRLLINEHVSPAPGLAVAGVEDFTSSRRHGGKAGENLDNALAGITEDAVILLSHTPWYTREAEEKNVDLMISGHTHAGQIWPFGLLVRMFYRYASGLYDIGRMKLIVSRGTGTWGPRMRFPQRSEIILLTLYSDRKESIEMKEDKALYRINCGSPEAAADSLGRTWNADRISPDAQEWGAVGGSEIAREPALRIDSKLMPDVLKTERCGLQEYQLPVPDGTYTLELYFAETFEGSSQPGRSFDISVNGKTAAENFSPFKAAGGFAKGAVLKKTLKSENGIIRISFDGKGAIINGIALLPAEGDESEVSIEPVEETCLPVPPAMPEKTAAPVSILFIGNSGTFYWDIPKTVEMLVNRGTDLHIQTEALTSGGKVYKWHFEQEKVLDKIRTGGYDYIVLQDGTKESQADDDDLEIYGGNLIEEVRAAGSEPILYAYYGPKKAEDKTWEKVISRYIALGEKYDVPVVPTCEVMFRSMKQMPDENFHNPDQHHSGMYGGFGFAAAFYHVLTGTSLKDHPYKAVLGDHVRVPDETAQKIITIADQVCEDYSKQTVIRKGPLAAK